jgi:F1F0 ATPase subunit 2
MNSQVLRLLAFLALGSGVGVGYLSALAWNVRLYCVGLTPAAFLLHLLRFLGAAAVFVALARLGAAPLLSGLVGFQLSRILVSGARLSTSQAGT